MKTYTQYGTFSIIAMVIAIIFCTGLLLITGLNEIIPVLIVGFVVLTLIMCLLIFYKLTITIDDEYLSFKLGIGLIRRQFRLSDIESCSPVRNSAIWGIGIRKIPGGWLYNVTGMEAIELTFKNSKRKIRIGTDRPVEIAGEVSNRVISGTAGSYYEKGRSQGMFLLFAMIVVTIAFVLILMIIGRQETEITLSDSAMTIKGMYGLDVKYVDIIQADTLQILPGIRARTNGFAAGGALKGRFKLDDGSNVMLFIIKGIPPYLLVKTQSKTIYLNSRTPSRTREIYQTLQARIPGNL